MELLPPELFLQIAQDVDFPTLLTLRLTCHDVKGLIDWHGFSITKVSIEVSAPSPLVTPRLNPNFDIPKWLLHAKCQRRQVAARRLAADAVVNTWPFSKCQDKHNLIRLLNAQIESGWHVMWQLADIAREVERSVVDSKDAGHQEPRPPLEHQSQRDSWDVNKIEATILAKQQEFIRTQLSWEDAHGFGVLLIVWSCVFVTRFDVGLADLKRGTRVVPTATSWVFWFIMRRGPSWCRDGFWDIDSAREEAMEEVQAAWTQRSEVAIASERAAGRKLLRVLEDKVEPGVRVSARI
ncbi:MAG: Allantoicase [Chaenotheca gracillima]|nr:MAG: Allantoicase [Chaenotheca gracillima]